MDTDRTGIEGRLLKFTLIGTFFGSVAVAAAQPARRWPRLGVLDFVLLGLASHRIGRMIAFERVAQPIREPFTEKVPDESGADETVVATGHGIRWVIGELMSCPRCVGTWAALFLYLGHTFAPRPTRVLTTVLAVAGIAELAYVGVEHLEWSARAARRASAPAN